MRYFRLALAQGIAGNESKGQGRGEGVCKGCFRTAAEGSKTRSMKAGMHGFDGKEDVAAEIEGWVDSRRASRVAVARAEMLESLKAEE